MLPGARTGLVGPSRSMMAWTALSSSLPSGGDACRGEKSKNGYDQRQWLNGLGLRNNKHRQPHKAHDYQNSSCKRHSSKHISEKKLELSKMLLKFLIKSKKDSC